MADTIDYLLQDAGALILAVDNNREAMNAKGFKETAYTALTAARQDLSIKETAQQKAVELAASKTAEQDEAIKNVQQRIQNVRNAAKSAYGKDEAKLRPFKIGEQLTASVKKLSTSCQYLGGLLLEQHDILLENGLTEEDVTGIHNAGGTLAAADTVQEHAKKLKEAATLARNTAAENLKDKMFRTRNFAKACFAGNKELLIQFKPIPKLKGGSGKDDEDAKPPEPPKQ